MKSPSRACKGTYTSMVWAREGGRGVGSIELPQAGKRDGGRIHKIYKLPAPKSRRT